MKGKIDATPTISRIAIIVIMISKKIECLRSSWVSRKKNFLKIFIKLFYVFANFKIKLPVIYQKFRLCCAKKNNISTAIELVSTLFHKKRTASVITLIFSSKISLILQNFFSKKILREQLSNLLEHSF